MKRKEEKMKNEKEQMKKTILSTNAFYNTSFDPDFRIKRFADDFERTILYIEEKCQPRINYA